MVNKQSTNSQQTVNKKVSIKSVFLQNEGFMSNKIKPNKGNNGCFLGRRKDRLA